MAIIVAVVILSGAIIDTSPKISPVFRGLSVIF